jgi:SAM-dependent methyltransferase
VLALGGAESVQTVDVNPWLTFSYARETWCALKPHLSEIAEMCRSSEREVHARYARVPQAIRTLDQLLEPLNIRYVYPGDARDTGLAADSVDIVLSSNVLEHIPRDVQEGIHRESLRILRAGGIAVHRFNPQDHYATVDRRITHANFLRYSSEEWHWYGGSGLAYHNRLRSRDFSQMFAAAGFSLEISRTRIDARSLESIQSGELPIHPEFAGYSPQELAGDYMWIVARKPLSGMAGAASTAEREMARA